MQLSVHQGQWRSSRASVCCRVLLLYRNWYTILGGLFSGLEWERFTTALECLTEVESRFELPPFREWIPVAAAVEDTLAQPEPSRLFLAPTEDEVTSIELSRGITFIFNASLPLRAAKRQREGESHCRLSAVSVA